MFLYVVHDDEESIKVLNYLIAKEHIDLDIVHTVEVSFANKARN